MGTSERSVGEELETALAAAAHAETVAQLRRCQSILIPALTGANLEITAAILGLGSGRIGALRKQFRNGDMAELRNTRGGRRRFLMAIEDEQRFLEPWLRDARTGQRIEVASVHIAYEQAVGHKVAKSTIYRLLARHGWSRP